MKNYIRILIVLTLWGISLIALYLSATTDYILDVKNYVSYGVLVLLTLFWLLKIRYFDILLIGVLILGLFNVISYSVIDYSLSFNFTVLGIKINSLGVQPLFLILLLLLIFSDFKTIKKYFEPKPYEGNDDFNVVDSFEEKYNDCSTSELKEIVQNKSSYQKEAVLAAENILKKRNE